ncbi:carbohydrate binding domain-containing protein [Maribellus mangrovi]|uniref:carbohydrate binding domain-containing protein n=1 Tax=Maribellus mangrovi TaxID=3133146 RepID=UPI0030ED5425
MKNYIKILLLSILSVSLLTTGCKEDDEFATVNISGLSVESAYPLDEVSISGSNLETVQSAFVGTEEAMFTFDGGTLNLTVPEDAKIGNSFITLVIAPQYRVVTAFEVLLRPTPVVQSISSSAVAVGSELTIRGLSFNTEYNPTVKIGGADATITSNTETELVVTVPNLEPYEQANVEVTTMHGTSKSKFSFFAGENLIVNGNLEAGAGNDFANWTKLNGGDGMTEVSGEDAYYGRAVRVVGAASDAWRTQFASDPIALIPNTEYTIVLLAKGEQDGAKMRVSVSQWPDDYFYGEDVEITTDWAQYAWTFTGQELEGGSRIVLDMGYTDVPFIVDNVTLIQGASVPVGDSPELLTNGSFEDDLNNWTVLNGPDNAEVTTADAYCGSKSLKVVGKGGNPWDVQVAADGVELVVGTQYEVSFWAKSAGEEGFFRMSASQWASGQSDDFFYSGNFNLTTDWAYYSRIFEAKETSTGDVKVLIDAGESTQTLYIDAVSLKEYVPKESLYANGGFEDDMTGWTILNGPDNAEVTTADAYEGSKSLKVVGKGGNPWDVQIAADGVVLTVGQQYKLSFWAKAAGEEGFFRMSASQWASGQSDDFFYSGNFELTTDWAYYTRVFEAKETSTGDVRVLVDAGESTQTIYIDNIIVTEYSDPCE